MKKLILLVVLMMSGMCFANTKQCNALIKRVDPLMREYLKMTWAGHAMDTQTLIKDYGNMDNAGSRVIMIAAQMNRMFVKMEKLKPTCDYVGSKEQKATKVYSTKIKENYGF